MGCRCCKMIQSYLFDPVQVPSPGYVNEVSGCKLDEEDAVKLRGKPGGEVPAHRHDLPRDGLRRTGSRARRPGPPGDPEKPGGALNGIGPAGDPGPPQGGAGSWASTARSVAPAHPSPDTDRAPVAGDRDARVSSEAVDGPDPAPQIPAPDYPPHRDLVDHGAKEEDLQGHPEEEEERPEEERTGSGEQGPDLPSSLPGKRSWGSGKQSWGSGRRSWGSVNGAVAAEALSVHLAEEDPAADRRAGPGGARCAPGGDGAAPEEEEDAEVAEALAALAAATAGEEVDDAD